MKRFSQGVAFGEHIKTEKIRRYKQSEQNSFSPRRYIILLCLFLVSAVLFFRLVNLQVVKGAYYRELADSNRTRTIVIYPPRGIILDRNNEPLVFNAPGYRKIEKDKIIFLDREEALKRIADKEPNIVVDALRHYPFQDAMAHVLGYVGQITEDQLESTRYSGYGLNDVIGKAGIEEAYEEVLRGIPGRQLVEVDAQGKAMRLLGQTNPIAGSDITLTIDSKVQESAFTAMKDVKKGAAIVSTPDGQILAMVSKPSYDPNLFTLGANYEATESAYKTVEGIVTDSENQPLLDRAISGTYPPASTFKLVTAASGLEEDIIDGSYTVEDNGVVRIGPYSFSNWYYTQYGGTDGIVDVVKGISRSNDIFFYKLADKIGVDTLSNTAAEFGVGKKIGIDVAGEADGVLPTRKWKEENVGESWYTGDTFIYGIGQGFLLTTPLQVNAWTQVIANGGTLYKSHLLKTDEPEVIRSEIIGSKSLDLIRQGMIDSCSPGGVAFPFYNFTVQNKSLSIDGKNILDAPVSSTSANLPDSKRVVIACKTGTAEQGGDEDHPHAWITVMAPAYNPEIVVTVLSEASGEGSQVAGPIAKEIVEDYFTQKHD